MNIQAALKRLVAGDDLTYDEMRAVMAQVMSGDATDAQIGALLMGLRIKGETIRRKTGFGRSQPKLGRVR